MASLHFLDRIASVLLDSHRDTMADTVVVLPNRRARIFLLEAIRKQTTQPLFAPRIISIEELIQDISGIRGIDSVATLFEFYQVYASITDIGAQQPFEQFANWAKTLLQDFNEIDRYLLDPDRVLRYLEDIKEIEHWSLSPDKTELVIKHLAFWKTLPDYYHALYAALLKSGIGYQGMVYREAVSNLNHFSTALESRHFLFAGFNALNAAEEQIIQHLLSLGQASIYWDADRAFLEDEVHEAGYFLRKIKNSWPYYKSHPFDWIVDDFATPKTIRIIGTPKTVGQAKIAGELVERITAAQPNAMQKTAIVMGEESLLIPLLGALPASVSGLNITMGYSARNNPIQILVAKLFKMHTGALARNPESYVLYYKDVLDVLMHPLVEPYANARTLADSIRQYNYTFITHKRLFEMQGASNELFELLFDRWTDTRTVLERLSNLLLRIKNHLDNSVDEDRIAKAFVYSVFRVITKLTDYFAGSTVVSNIDTLYAIYKQVIDMAEVSFEGEPLDGLQVMGVLESRVLDFDTVIVTSMNEGKFPAGKSQNSFIPYDVKRELGLPTFKEKDAIYTYHFYHLLQRAKTVYLLYNTENEGLDGGEKSRFLTQLEIERQPLHDTTHQFYNAHVPNVVQTPIVVPKSQKVLDWLREIADSGFSPSALTSYLRNPIDFYFQKVLRIRETDTVEENIALNTLGTIIHGTLEALYTPTIGRLLTSEDLEQSLKKVDAEVLHQFKQVYKEGEIKKGRNLLAFEVAKRNVSNFLKLERAALEDGVEIQILALEQKFDERFLLHDRLPFPVKIGGTVDRIEYRKERDSVGRIRITDYKTGRVDANQLVLKDWDALLDIKSEKVIQLLAYAFMYEPYLEGHEVELGILSFKNLKAGFMPFKFKEVLTKTETTVISPEILEAYKEKLVDLLLEIFDPEQPFIETID